MKVINNLPLFTMVTLYSHTHDMEAQAHVGGATQVGGATRTIAFKKTAPLRSIRLTHYF